jgi:hypothetical protein
VRLQHKARHASGLEAMRELDVVEHAREHIGRTMDVGVEGTLEQALDRVRIYHHRNQEFILEFIFKSKACGALMLES